MWFSSRFRRIVLGSCLAAMAASQAWAAEPAQSEDLLTDAVHRLACRYDTFAGVPDDPQGRVVYGTSRGYLHLLRYTGRHYREIWVSPLLGSRIQRVLVADLKHDGTYQILATTTRGVIYVYDVDTFAPLWQSQDQQFRTVEAIGVGNLDNDDQLEILFVSEGRLYIYDGLHFIEEWRSDALFDAHDVVVGDVDNDGTVEIVLSSGHVLDGRSRTLEWECTQPFGTHLELADVDGDGKLELIAGDSDVVTIWNLDERRQKWD